MPPIINPEIIEATAGLGQYGAIGVVILAISAVVIIVYGTFKFNASQSQLNREAIAEQSELNRESHKENTVTMSATLSEMTKVVSQLGSEQLQAHTEIRGTHKTILHEIREVKAKIKN